MHFLARISLCVPPAAGARTHNTKRFPVWSPTQLPIPNNPGSAPNNHDAWSTQSIQNGWSTCSNWTTWNTQNAWSGRLTRRTRGAYKSPGSVQDVALQYNARILT